MLCIYKKQRAAYERDRERCRCIAISQLIRPSLFIPAVINGQTQQQRTEWAKAAVVCYSWLNSRMERALPSSSENAADTLILVRSDVCVGRRHHELAGHLLYYTAVRSSSGYGLLLALTQFLKD